MTNLDVDEEPLQRPVGVVDGQVEVELLHEEELAVEDDVGGLLLVALDVVEELVHGHVELLYLARQERRCYPGRTPKSDALEGHFQGTPAYRISLGW